MDTLLPTFETIGANNYDEALTQLTKYEADNNTAGFVDLNLKMADYWSKTPAKWQEGQGYLSKAYAARTILELNFDINLRTAVARQYAIILEKTRGGPGVGVWGQL